MKKTRFYLVSQANSSTCKFCILQNNIPGLLSYLLKHTRKSTSVSVCFRGISRLPSAFVFLRWFKLAHISIQVCTMIIVTWGIHSQQSQWECCNRWQGWTKPMKVKKHWPTVPHINLSSSDESSKATLGLQIDAHSHTTLCRYITLQVHFFLPMLTESNTWS